MLAISRLEASMGVEAGRPLVVPGAAETNIDPCQARGVREVATKSSYGDGGKMSKAVM